MLSGSYGEVKHVSRRKLDCSLLFANGPYWLHLAIFRDGRVEDGFPFIVVCCDEPLYWAESTNVSHDVLIL